MPKNFLKELRKFSSPERKKKNEYFFKTGKGEYGEGDVFIGVSVPDVRNVAKKYYSELSLTDLERVIRSKVHEERLLALEILNFKYEKSARERSSGDQKKIYNFYLKNIKYVNNWDLVDSSAPYILGDYLFNHKDRVISLLKKMAKSADLWQKRVAIVSCYYFINKKSAKEILEIAEIVKYDKHDLLQKALGWMLREVYKNVDQDIVRKFLAGNIEKLPRTTLRYAIEKMGEVERRGWLVK